jgi:energy-coupling factor transport system substrate-specific component
MTLDDVAKGLQNLRIDNGSMSFSDISKRIEANRMSAGTAPHAAVQSRSTVYHCFEPGRKRIDMELVGEIVFAITDDNEQAEQWRQCCVDAMKPAAESTASATSASLSHTTVLEQKLLSYAPMAMTWRYKIILVVAGALLDYLGAYVGRGLSSWLMPLFLDMIGTCVVAAVLGPWWGILAQIGDYLAYNWLPWGFTITLKADWYIIAGAAGSLVWGYGVRRFHMGRNLTRFFSLSLISGFFVALFAVPVNVFVFSEFGANPNVANLGESIHRLGHSLFTSVTMASVFTNMLDKVLTGGIVLLIISIAIPRYAPTDLVTFRWPRSVRSWRQRRRADADESLGTSSSSLAATGASERED